MDFHIVYCGLGIDYIFAAQFIWFIFICLSPSLNYSLVTGMDSFLIFLSMCSLNLLQSWSFLMNVCWMFIMLFS